MISFRGAQFPKEAILSAVFFYIRRTVSYRIWKRSSESRGVQVDRATLNRWVAKYPPLIAANARRWKAPTDRSWRMDETCIRVKGEWVYLNRAIDKFGNTLDFASRTFGSCCRNAATNWLQPGFLPGLWK